MQVVKWGVYNILFLHPYIVKTTTLMVFPSCYQYHLSFSLSPLIYLFKNSLPPPAICPFPSLLCGHYHFVSTTSLLIPCWNHHLPLLPHVATTSLPSFISFLHAKWNQHFGRVYKQTLKRKCKLASILYKINIYIYIYI